MFGERRPRIVSQVACHMIASESLDSLRVT